MLLEMQITRYAKHTSIERYFVHVPHKKVFKEITSFDNNTKNFQLSHANNNFITTNSCFYFAYVMHT